MIKNIKSVRGMKHYSIDDSKILQRIEKILKKVLLNYGYEEIRFPIIEYSEIFQNTIGQMNDVVEKEMFTFKNKKNKFLTLRPEGTAGCINSIIKNNNLKSNNIQKIWYSGPMFRYERPQKGRYRQFHQLGAEVCGLIGPNIDVEIILMNVNFWKKLNISQYLTLHINSIGSYSDRIKYKNLLIKFLEKNKDYLDKNYKNKLYTNSMRILDSKDYKIIKLLENAPKIKDYINPESQKHFHKLCKMLDYFNISYNIDDNLVRGLDYYNNTVFEWKTKELGTQDAICAGGRYDGLTKKLGYNISLPGIGFAIGIDRLLLLIKKSFEIKICTDLYIIFNNKNIEILSIELTEEIREKCKNFKIIIDFNEINRKKVFSYANKKLARFLLFIEENSFKKENFFLKDLKNRYEYFLSKKDLIKKIPKFLKQSSN